MRNAVLIIALVFVAGLAALTVDDFIRHGVTVVGVLAVGIIVLFMIGLVGALRQRPPSSDD